MSDRCQPPAFLDSDWMVDQRPAAAAETGDGDAWIYLIAPLAGEGHVRKRVVEACEEGGWPTVAWPEEGFDHDDPGHLFEDVRHAVEHADSVIALLGETDGIADAELALAYSHRRPIIGLQLTDSRSPASEVQAMLQDYERARVVSCEDPEECAVRLSKVLADPDFGATINQAVGERAADL